jgi:iron complex transport system ATP-binding protein
VSLRGSDLTCSYGSTLALNKVSLQLEPGELVGILGPNGSGKSTLLKVLAGVLLPASGQVLLEERPLSDYRRRELACRLAYVPQQVELPFPFRCRELVMMGRYARMRGPGLQEGAHLEAVRQAMRATGVEALAERRFGELSGGEAQRVRIAQALAQEGQTMLLDEPTSHLDVAFQLELMGLLSSLAARGQALAASLHDLNLAALFCHRLVLLKAGQVVASGVPAEVLTVERLEQAFGVRLEVQPGPPVRVFARNPEPVGETPAL